MQALDVSEPQAFGPAARVVQHLLRHIDPGHPRIPPEMRKRQSGANADLENTLTWPVIGDANGIFPPGVKDRAEYNVVGAREQPVGPDRIVQVHHFALFIMDRTHTAAPSP